MIKFSLQSKENKIIGFELKGHANFADYGNDIICAAVSALAINTINSITTFTQDTFDYTVDEKKGHLFFRIISNVSDESNLLLNALNLGITGIKEEYDNGYIEIIHEEV